MAVRHLPLLVELRLVWPTSGVRHQCQLSQSTTLWSNRLRLTEECNRISTQPPGPRNAGSSLPTYRDYTTRNTPTMMNITFGMKYQWFAKAAANRYHSVAVGVIADLSAEAIDVDSDLPMVEVRVPWPFPIAIVSVYLLTERQLA